MKNKIYVQYLLYLSRYQVLTFIFYFYLININLILVSEDITRIIQLFQIMVILIGYRLILQTSEVEKQLKL